MRNWLFWLEVAVIFVHCPPYITDEYHTYSFGNLIVYRAETFGALVNSCRLYLVWRYYRDHFLHKVPKRLTVESFTGARFGSVYMFKTNMHGRTGARNIVIFWCLSILMCGYWMRSAEMNACHLPSTISVRCRNEVRATSWVLFGQEFEHVNNLHLLDSTWLCLISSLTVGYGNIL